MLTKILRSQKFNYNTYFVAGIENIRAIHMQKNESKEDTLIRIVKDFAENGLDVFQLRCKKSKDLDLIRYIYKISKVIENTNCKLCLNDNPKLAVQTKDVVDILHIGQDDMSPEKAKDMIGTKMKLGLSITNISQLDKVPKCVDYLGVGPIYPTPSKNDASLPIGELGLQSIILKTTLPVIAIGGIKIKNAKKLFEIGVSGIALISELLKKKDNIEVVRKLKKIAKI